MLLGAAVILQSICTVHAARPADEDAGLPRSASLLDISAKGTMHVRSEADLSPGFGYFAEALESASTLFDMVADTVVGKAKPQVNHSSDVAKVETAIKVAAAKSRANGAQRHRASAVQEACAVSKPAGGNEKDAPDAMMSGLRECIKKLEELAQKTKVSAETSHAKNKEYSEKISKASKHLGNLEQQELQKKFKKNHQEAFCALHEKLCLIKTDFFDLNKVDVGACQEAKGCNGGSAKPHQESDNPAKPASDVPVPNERQQINEPKPAPHQPINPAVPEAPTLAPPPGVQTLDEPQEPSPVPPNGNEIGDKKPSKWDIVRNHKGPFPENDVKKPSIREPSNPEKPTGNEVKVEIVKAEGLQKLNGKPYGGNTYVLCHVEVPEGEEVSEDEAIKTVSSKGADPVWNYEGTLEDIDESDVLEFEIKGENNRVIAKAVVPVKAIDTKKATLMKKSKSGEWVPMKGAWLYLDMQLLPQGSEDNDNEEEEDDDIKGGGGGNNEGDNGGGDKDDDDVIGGGDNGGGDKDDDDINGGGSDDIGENGGGDKEPISPPGPGVPQVDPDKKPEDDKVNQLVKVAAIGNEALKAPEQLDKLSAEDKKWILSREKNLQANPWFRLTVMWNVAVNINVHFIMVKEGEAGEQVRSHCSSRPTTEDSPVDWSPCYPFALDYVDDNAAVTADTMHMVSIGIKEGEGPPDATVLVVLELERKEDETGEATPAVPYTTVLEMPKTNKAENWIEERVDHWDDTAKHKLLGDGPFRLQDWTAKKLEDAWEEYTKNHQQGEEGEEDLEATIRTQIGNSPEEEYENAQEIYEDVYYMIGHRWMANEGLKKEGKDVRIMPKGWPKCFGGGDIELCYPDTPACGSIQALAKDDPEAMQKSEEACKAAIRAVFLDNPMQPAHEANPPKFCSVKFSPDSALVEPAWGGFKGTDYGNPELHKVCEIGVTPVSVARGELDPGAAGSGESVRSVQTAWHFKVKDSQLQKLVTNPCGFAGIPCCDEIQSDEEHKMCVTEKEVIARDLEKHIEEMEQEEKAHQLTRGSTEPEASEPLSTPPTAPESPSTPLAIKYTDEWHNRGKPSPWDLVRPHNGPFPSGFKPSGGEVVTPGGIKPSEPSQTDDEPDNEPSTGTGPSPSPLAIKWTDDWHNRDNPNAEEPSEPDHPPSEPSQVGTVNVEIIKAEGLEQNYDALYVVCHIRGENSEENSFTTDTASGAVPEWDDKGTIAGLSKGQSLEFLLKVNKHVVAKTYLGERQAAQGYSGHQTLFDSEGNAMKHAWLYIKVSPGSGELVKQEDDLPAQPENSLVPASSGSEEDPDSPNGPLQIGGPPSDEDPETPSGPQDPAAPSGPLQIGGPSADEDPDSLNKPLQIGGPSSDEDPDSRKDPLQDPESRKDPLQIGGPSSDEDPEPSNKPLQIGGPPSDEVTDPSVPASNSAEVDPDLGKLTGPDDSGVTDNSIGGDDSTDEDNGLFPRQGQNDVDDIEDLPSEPSSPAESLDPAVTNADPSVSKIEGGETPKKKQKRNSRGETDDDFLNRMTKPARTQNTVGAAEYQQKWQQNFRKEGPVRVKPVEDRVGYRKAQMAKNDEEAERRARVKAEKRATSRKATSRGSAVAKVKSDVRATKRQATVRRHF